MTIEVSRGSTHDGPGLRTTVFTKGCPLACRWCQNPESLSPHNEIWYEVTVCIGCLECVNTCSRYALEAAGTGISINRNKCTGCGACVAVCPSKALSFTGTTWTMDELVREVMKDKTYYDEFGGGVTVSGGEPLIHADFLIDFFKKLKECGVQTALDTCGYFSSDIVMKVIPYTDAVLYDLKLIDSEKHRELTGRDNELILDNLKLIADYIRKMQAKKNRNILLWIRTPLIPGDTSTEGNIKKIAAFITAHILDVTGRWELCAFNSACFTKYTKMQKPWPYEGQSPMRKSAADTLRNCAVSGGIPEKKLEVTGITIPDIK